MASAGHPNTTIPGPVRPTAATRDELTELHRLCREGKLYEVEAWIRSGKPLQIAAEAPVNRGWYRSALHVALESGQHSLARLLLSSGYRLELEHRSPFDVALKKHREDLVDLLFEFGADPKQAEPDWLFQTYSMALYERFWAAEFDFTRHHYLACYLGDGSSNRPLFGFVRRHRSEASGLQTELNMALGLQVKHGSERGVHLCLWAGADPHTPAPGLESWTLPQGEEDGGDSFIGWSAVEEAVNRGEVDILRLLGPDPTKDDFGELYASARDGAIVGVLASVSPPKVTSQMLVEQTRWLDRRWPHGRSPIGALEGIFKAGGRWEIATTEEIADIRRNMLRAEDHGFAELMRVLSEGEHCQDTILQELARTPGIRERMKRVGFFESPDNWRPDYLRPRGARGVLQKCGLMPPPKRSSLPPVVAIGSPYSATESHRTDRQRLYEQVWTEPIENLARAWGLSGRGLSKACARLKIPTPPRGYWASLRAGNRMRWTRLSAVPEGEAREIVIHITRKGQPARGKG